MPEISNQPFDEPVLLADHDPEWEARSQVEIRRLQEATESLDSEEQSLVAGFEHFGSTSVPSLRAKPIIGIMCGIRSWPPSEELIECFQSVGYLYYGQMGRRRRHYLRIRNGQHFNIHIIEYDKDVWRDNLLFREFLKSHPNEREDYQMVKEQALEESEGQLNEYGSIKSQHMRSLLQRAQWWLEEGRSDEGLEARIQSEKVRKQTQRAVARAHRDWMSWDYPSRAEIIRSRFRLLGDDPRLQELLGQQGWDSIYYTTLANNQACWEGTYAPLPELSHLAWQEAWWKGMSGPPGGSKAHPSPGIPHIWAEAPDLLQGLPTPKQRAKSPAKLRKPKARRISSKSTSLNGLTLDGPEPLKKKT